MRPFTPRLAARLRPGAALAGRARPAGAPPEVWEATRARVATEGFGARLLALQDPDGQWAGGAFFPEGFDFHGPEAADGAGQPWTATTWTLNTLREWGLDAAALAGTAERLAANCRWEYDDLPYWGGEVDCCINALDARQRRVAGRGRGRASRSGSSSTDWRMAAGTASGSNGSTRSSFHSTLNSLKGLLAYEAATGGSDELRAARRAGEEYLLERRLMYRASTGELVGAVGDAVRLPFRWAFSVLNAADYFRAAALHDGTPPDPRLAEAIAVDPRGPPARRHLAAGVSPPRAGLVRGRRAAGRAVEVAHVRRHAGAGVVGRFPYLTRASAGAVPAACGRGSPRSAAGSRTARSRAG